MKKLLAFALAVLCCSGSMQAQSAKGMAIPLKVSYPANGRGIIISWPRDAEASDALISRRVKSTSLNFTTATGTNAFGFRFLNDTAALDTTFVPGVTTEYQLRRTPTFTTNTAVKKVGVTTVCRNCAPVDNRGILLLVAEKLIRDSLPTELNELRQDLWADGWQVQTVPVTATETVEQVKTKIRLAYDANPGRVKMVYLLGDVAAPYSGEQTPDGHQDHKGAWPSDGYYVAFDVAFQDVARNTVQASRAENRNVPGDGKFDENNFFGHQGRLGLTRVSMYNLPAFTQVNSKWNEVFLTRRYLQKAHRFKSGLYTTNGNGLIDDNFGYFGGEAFSASGWISMYSSLGTGKALAGDFILSSRTAHWLMAYGCGGGSYNVCLDVAGTENCVLDSLNAVFTHFFGSYFGDWDTPNNFLRATLANKGGVLSSSWSGRPWHYYHLMGAGEPLGETARINLFNTSERRLHLHSFHGSVANAFMGDPSLRMHYFRPPGKPVVTASNGIARLSWTRSPDAAVEGYHVYRSAHADSTWSRLTANAIRDTAYRDTLPRTGSYHYMVRGLRTQAYPGGSYPNLSLGAIANPVSVVVSNQPELATQISLYPNPTSGTVRVEAGATIRQIEVLDGLGRSVRMLEPNSITTEVGLAELPHGVYTFRIRTSDGLKVRRVIRL